MNHNGFGLHLPFLLITDGSHRDEVAQQLLTPVAQLLHSPENQPESPAILDTPSHTIRSLIKTLQSAQPSPPGLIAIGWPPGNKAQHRMANAKLPLGMGSRVFETLLRQTACPLLVMRVPETEGWEPSWKRVLLVVNRSDATKQAIAITQQLIPAGVQQVTILNVQPPLSAPYPLGPFSPFAMPMPSWQLTHSLQQVQKEQGEHLVSRVQSALKQSAIEIQLSAQVGEPGATICRMAEQADVIIMGYNSIQWVVAANRTPVFRYARLSAVSHYVLQHAPCPVLFCRTSHLTLPLKLFSQDKAKQQAQTGQERSAQDTL
ncbi:universal stress protein [Oculatella sp. LEGE 06141]|uniref:universal stress protein n=1 Tax=Oculatella sp. LEGE 06141 TaxID=1828648 RepID=UPI0018829E77|nr:universal stress protein [Oculatella sp. LEGE 06141]MBE9181496.1 universal stress protein [Oculatella sp. LEGE 06141]